MARPPLHAVDAGDPPAGAPGAGGSSHGERLARIEARMEHVATREDLSEIKASIEGMRTSIEQNDARRLRWLRRLVVVAAITLIVGLVRTFIIP